MQLDKFFINTVKIVDADTLKSNIENELGIKFSVFYVRGSVATGVVDNGNWVEFGYDEDNKNYFAKIKRKFTSLRPDVETHSDMFSDIENFLALLIPFVVVEK